jgi:DNA mismatch repair protein MutL
VELRHITDEFHRVCLAHPSVQFYFYNNDSELFNLPSTNLKKRVVHIFGIKTKEKLVPIEEETQVVRISGFICKPEYAKKSRGEQFFFVNNRFIKSPYLHHAVMASFDGLLRTDTSPGYFIYLDVDPSSIDINIHPTKTEIKFDDEHTLYAILKSTIKHSLGQFNVSPALDFEKDQNLDTPYVLLNKQAQQPDITINPGYNPFKEDGFENGAGRFSKRLPAGEWESMYVGLESKVGREESFSTVHFESDTITGSIFEEQPGEEGIGATTFQLRRKYIVTTIKSGMLIIDQGRAHQRVLYEKFLKSITVKETLSQQLLFPISVTFSKAELAVLDEIKESLTSLGFAFGAFEREELQITGIPQLINESEVGGLLDQLIADYQMEISGNVDTQSEVLSKVLCKSLAVKTGEILDKESQQALVNALFACKETNRSPFNKLIYVTITERDIDNKFN